MSNYDIHSHVEKRQQEFINKHKLSSVRTTAQKQIKGEKFLDKEKKQKNPHYKTSDLYHKASEHARKVNNEVRDKLHEGYSKMSHSHPEELKHHILSTFVKGSHEHALPYVKVHGSGGHDKPATAHATDPSDNEMYHKIRNAHHLSFHKSGQGNITVKTHEHEHDEHGKKAMSLQVKHVNGPLTGVSVLAGH